MPAGAAEILLRMGLPGLVILALAWAYWNERKTVQQLQQERIADAKAVTQTLLDLHEKTRQTAEATRATLGAQGPVLERIEEFMQELKEALQRRAR